MGFVIKMPYGFLASFWKIETLSRTRDDCHVSTFVLGYDNFIGIRAFDFQNFSFIFRSLVDIGRILIIVYHVSEFKHLSPFVDKMNIPSRRGHD